MSNLFKVVMLVSVLLSVLNCASADKNYKWENSLSASDKQNNFKTGDIIIKNKIIKDPKSWFGHSAIMIDEYNIGDFPKPGHDYLSGYVFFWLKEDRKIIVLRYDGFNDEFKKKFEENAKKYGNGKYMYSFDKRSPSNFYCSKYVWFVYYQTAQDLGYNLDIDRDGGLFVYPYDFLGNSEFHQVYIVQEQK